MHIFVLKNPLVDYFLHLADFPMANVLCVEPAAFFAPIEIQNSQNAKDDIIEEHKILSDIYEKLKTHFER